VGRLDGKVALVTGGARGQGAAEARLFLAEGASVVIADVLDDQGEALATELGPCAAYRHLDVSDEEGWATVMGELVGRLGRLDVLVNNAGILRVSPLEETSLADYRRVVDVNQIGTFLGMRAAIGPMRDAGGGSIVNVSSTQGIVGMIGLVSYVSTKFAIRGMTKSAAMELGPSGIRVNSVHPGGVDTEMLRDPALPTATDDDRFATLPLGRIGTPEEIARLVLFLASDDSSYCTGAEFVADGGSLAGPRRT
jgi:3alpha(or 20beta)-hydroxysteroid dehydrogenase